MIKDDILRDIMASKLRDLRLRSGLSQDELAIAVEMSRSSVSNMEVGDHGITTDLIFKFRAVFDCDYAEFFPTPEEHQPDIIPVKKQTAEQRKLTEKIRKLQQKLREIS